jgi:hypothetical protein
MSTQVSVKISGPAFRVTAYVIDSKILKQLQSATEEDALYEDNPLTVVGNLALRSIRVANGFCMDGVGDFKVEVLLGDESQEIEEIGTLYDGCEFHEEFDSDIEKTLIAREENDEPVGEEFPIAKNEMLVLEFEEIKLGEIACSFDAARDVTLEDLELGLVDLDVDSHISQATYELGLLNGMEKDIRYVIVDGQKYEFDMDVLSGYASRFMLVKRNKDGNWVASDL